MDLISRQAAIDAIERNAYRHTYIDQIVGIINGLPSVQERKKGYDTGLSRWFHCSECGYGVNDVYLDDEHNYDLEYHYCPNCGAKMEGAEDAGRDE